jgi:hypothetical protein
MRPEARRTTTTVVAVVGDDAAARAATERLGQAANVGWVVPDPDDAALGRAVAAWSLASRSHAPYFVHDADPLRAVADAWVRHYDEQGPRGELEVAAAETLARWRPGSIELPDYYLALDPASWAPTRRHWYLGVLHDAAPSRVAPADLVPAADVIEHLRAGRWWPELDVLLDGIDRIVPDRVGAPGRRGDDQDP